jgi:pSer/pThr/pTyr-binding forkhead associated (FHA) protein
MGARCPKCRYINEDGADACSLCSEVLPLRPGEIEMLEEPRQMRGGKTSARHQRVSDTRVHCLVPPGGAPIQLTRNVRFVMGRDPRCSLSIAAEDVTKQHAEILWSGDDPPDPRVRDIRSRNGTFVNQERLQEGEERDLRHGDELRLAGSFVCSYRFKALPDLDKELLAEKRLEQTGAIRLPPELGASGAAAPPSRAPSAAAVPAGGGLAGDFAVLPARQVLLLLEHLQASGSLEIDGEARGLVELSRGAPVRVAYAGLSGVAAMMALGSLELGRFTFSPRGGR